MIVGHLGVAGLSMLRLAGVGSGGGKPLKDGTFSRAAETDNADFHGRSFCCRQNLISATSGETRKINHQSFAQQKPRNLPDFGSSSFLNNPDRSRGWREKGGLM